MGDAPLLELSTAMLEAEHSLGRPVHLNLYGVEEWVQLRQTDPVIAQITEASKIRILPHATPR